MSEHYCCNNCISIILLCRLPGYRKHCRGMLIYVSKTEGQGSSSHTWSALLLLPSVSPAIGSTEEQEKTWKKYEWSWSCLTLGVTLCTILIFKGAFICGSHPPPRSLTLPEQLVSWLWQGGSNTAPAHWDAAQEMVNARSILWTILSVCGYSCSMPQCWSEWKHFCLFHNSFIARHS